MPASAETAVVIEYLNALQYNRRIGVKETSNYPALERLFNDVGKPLQVRCIIHPKSKGAGIPDGGFFTASQLKIAVPDESRLLTQTPERGAIEVKGTSEDVLSIAASEQLSKYLKQYGQVLVTNCYDFQLVTLATDGTIQLLERFCLGANEDEFWRAATHPQQLAAIKGTQFIEYLQRVMRRAAPLSRPQDVAWFLASYARDAKARIEGIELEALTRVRTALEEALGMQFTGERGEHFFRSTLIQTLFYGLFSAWVLWSRSEAGQQPTARFDWRIAGWYLHVPMVSALFNQVANRQQLQPLGLVEVLDWTGETLNQIERAKFFASFDEGQAVQYFYEPFLEAYDPELRAQLGVWYTPSEIIDYMVERVDWALRHELGITDGLADPNVYVLDPCCGTGGYLVSVLKRITRTLQARGEDALTAQDVKRAATTRIFGFEILPAPFVVAHLQLGLFLQQLGTSIAGERNERAAVYLTNALTGWEPPDPAKEQYVQRSLAGMPELMVERDAAQQVKQQVPILVILGNPPYNAFAGTSPEEENSLVEPYKHGLFSEWGIRKYNLDDLYVRFFRLAERRIAEQLGKGVVCYISNFSYLSDPSFVVMRERFLREFDGLWFDCLNGDSRETGKLTPEGKPDPSVFSTEFNREGIRVGTTVGLFVRDSQRASAPAVYFRQYWGANKRADLGASLQDPELARRYERVEPLRANRYSFRPSTVTADYRRWPTIIALSGQTPISGLQEMRKGALMDIDRDQLAARMRQYFDPTIGWEEIAALQTGLSENGGGFDARSARPKILTRDTFHEENLVRYALYPFDLRWAYHSVVPSLWNRPRPNLVAQNWPGNQFFIVRMVAERSNEHVPVTLTNVLPDYHLLRPNAVAIPLQVLDEQPKRVDAQTAQATLFAAHSEPREAKPTANLSSAARAYLAELGAADPDSDSVTGRLIWMHALATCFTPAYLTDHADGIRESWPRVPLPADLEHLRRSAALGSQVAALLDTEQLVPGVTTGAVDPCLVRLGNLATTDNRPASVDAGDLHVVAGWGHLGKDNVTMPGKGKVTERPYTAEELAAFAAGDVSADQVGERFGSTTCDVFLNDRVYWRNIPTRVWEYRIGGYQVIKKWLSYREHALLGRSLTPEEAREVTKIVRRIAALLLLEPALDASYRATIEDTYPWPAANAPTEEAPVEFEISGETEEVEEDGH